MAAFAQLVTNNHVGRVTLAFERTVEASFVSHAMPSGKITRAEVVRRFDLCAKIFELLRSDLKWGIDRILDKLPTYLGCELDGADWAADARDARTIWTPPDGVS